MSTQTTNLNLVKPGDNDALDIADINDNMDTLDAAVGAVDVQTDGSLQEQINDLGESVNKITWHGVKDASFWYNSNSGTFSIEATCTNDDVVSLTANNSYLTFIRNGSQIWQK